MIRKSTSAEAPINTVGELWEELRLDPLNSDVWLELSKAYLSLNLLWQASYAAQNAIRLDNKSRLLFDDLLYDLPKEGIKREIALGYGEFSDELRQKHTEFIIQVFNDSSDWLTWLYLTRIIQIAEQSPLFSPSEFEKDNPISLYDAQNQAQRFEPIAGETLHLLGVWQLHSGDYQGAVTTFYPLVNQMPLRHGSMMQLAEALLKVGNIPAAEKAFTRASHSNNPDFLVTLADKVYKQNYWSEAIEILKKAVLLAPNKISALVRLADIECQTYSLSDCRNTLDRIHMLSPGNKDALGIEASFQGKIGDAKSHLEICEEIGGDPLSRVASSSAMSFLYQDELSFEETAERHRSLCVPIENGIVPYKGDFKKSNGKNRSKRLRIGYVTGDLHRQHPVNIFMLPVLMHYNHDKFEHYIYHTGVMYDQYTRLAKEHSDEWRECSMLDDTALHQRILSDKIDILVDLAGHTSTHRLGVFVMRSAPVQATFLGYPHSTGLTRMDWIIGDPIVSPVKHAHLFSEKIAQMPHSVFCWGSIDEYPLPSNRDNSAPVVFASFNNAMKLSPRTITLWSRILHEVPDSKLLLKTPSFKDELVKARYLALFAKHNIFSDRLDLRGPTGLSDMMQEYGDVDIGLDPTPYNGGTTTLQAMWMGVPIITLMGGNFVSRMGASFLNTLGYLDCIAKDEDDYVAIAVKMAQDISTIRHGRAQRREKMAQSPLCDIEGYTRDIESLFRKMWHHYCDGKNEGFVTLKNVG